MQSIAQRSKINMVLNLDAVYSWDKKTQGNKNIEEIATLAGLDLSKFNACLSSEKSAKAIEGDMREAQSRGIKGTPAIFLNGKEVGGAIPFENFKPLIDKELNS